MVYKHGPASNITTMQSCGALLNHCLELYDESYGRQICFPGHNAILILFFILLQMKSSSVQETSLLWGSLSL